MKALITGASSGIGRDIARELAKRGYELIITARREDRLKELKNELSVKTEIYVCDLSKEEECFKLFEKYKDANIDILVNNAGLGLFGECDEVDLNKELNMINVNVKSLHILTKLFLKVFAAQNKGIILNTASSAAFMPGGPFLSAYYATKAYVLSLTQGIAKELRAKKSKVKICALCPGPVTTEFSDVAGGDFKDKGLTSEYVAKYAVKKAFSGKTVIVPGFKIKAGRILTRILPTSVLMEFAYRFQSARKN